MNPFNTPARLLFAIVFSFVMANASASSLVINGTDGDDTVLVTASSANGGKYRVNDGPEIPFRNVTSLTFNGGNGNDTLRIVNPPHGLFAPNEGIFCNGEGESGPPGDKLEMVGGASIEARYAMGPTVDAGIIRREYNGLTQLIKFTGLEPVNDTVGAANFTFTAPAGATVINVVDGPIVSGFQTTQINDGGTGAFEELNFANKANVTINAGSGVNTVTVNIPTPATGMSDLTVDAGAEVGDIINVGVINLPGGVSVINSAGAVTVNSGGGITAVNGIGITAGTTTTLNGSLSSSSGFVGLNGGGAITQASGAPITANGLLVIGSGPATLTATGNSTNNFAADLSNAVSYTNAGNLTILSISILGFGSAGGVDTTNDPIDVRTVDGTLSVNKPVNAGNSTTALTAGSASGSDRALTLNEAVTGTGGVTLSADNMDFTNASAAVDAGTNIAILRPFENGTVIDVGGADAAHTLGLTDAELDKVTAGILRVGAIANTAGLSVTAPISKAGSGYTTLTLLNGGNVVETGAGALIETNLGVQGSGVNLPNATNAIDNIGGTATGLFSTAFLLTNNIPLNIADVDTFSGLSCTRGGISVTNNGTISLTSVNGFEAVLGGTAGTVSLLANGAAADVLRTTNGDAITNPGGDIQVQAGRDVLFGAVGSDNDNDVRANKGVFLTAGRDIVVDGFSDVASDDFGNNTGFGVSFTAERNISISKIHGNDASVGANGNASADVTLVTGLSGVLTLTAPGGVFSNSGDVTITADRVVIDSGSEITAAGLVTIQQKTNPWNINLGSTTDAAANTLELSDAELDRITSPSLQIGDIANTGDIGVSAAITAANYTTLGLRNSGNLTGPSSITVSNLVYSDGGSTGRTYTINGSASPNTFQKGAAATIPFSATTLGVNGGSGGDGFNIKASPTATITIDGNNPTTIPGDTLTYDGEGRTVFGDATPPSGSITSPGVQAVNFQEIEAVNVINFITSVSVDNVTIAEGNAPATDAVFTVSLVAPSSSTVTVDFFTSDGTATAGSDYLPRSGSRTFAPGETTKTVTVPILGDTQPEADETFFVNLTDASNAAIETSQGKGTIVNDDGPIPTPTPTPTPAPTPTPTAAPTATATPTPTPAGTPTPSPTPTPTPAQPADAQNISTRLVVGTGENQGIAGLIITTGTDKRVLIRGIGPTLTQSGVSGVLQDPVLNLYASGGTLLFTNDNWRDSQETEIAASRIPPSNDLESAMIATLPSGQYTVILSGNNSTTGFGLVEVYDLDTSGTSRLGNLSTRGKVMTGDQVMIGGFILGKNAGNETIIVRGLGPSLSNNGVAGPLSDPTLELRDKDGTLLLSNDNWQDDPTQAAAIAAAGLAPNDPKESAIFATLPPGNFTAILAGRNGDTGVGLVELYFQ